MAHSLVPGKTLRAALILGRIWQTWVWSAYFLQVHGNERGLMCLQTGGPLSPFRSEKLLMKHKVDLHRVQALSLP